MLIIHGTGYMRLRLKILFHSLDKDYLLVNTPWLIGSIGTIAEDITIFIQFHVFKNRGEDHLNAIS